MHTHSQTLGNKNKKNIISSHVEYIYYSNKIYHCAYFFLSLHRKNKQVELHILVR